MIGKEHLAWCEIDLRAIRHNYREIRRLAKDQLKGSNSYKGSVSPKAWVLSVIKADAYGHGMLEVAKVLNSSGVDFFGVSDVGEGIALRENRIQKPILLFESTLPACAKQIVKYDLTPTVCTLNMASSLNTHAQAARKTVDVHVKIDTGMGRLGISYEEAPEFIDRMLRFSHLSIRGIYTHFPMADKNPRFTQRQIKLLCEFIHSLEKQKHKIPYIHAANSMGLLGGYKHHCFNIARPGLMIYGLYPSPVLKQKVKLKSVMSIKARVIFFKSIKKGQGISYGHTFVARKDTIVAILPIGYSEGYFRSFSNKAHVLIGGTRCPVIGNVTMDQIMVDVSAVKSVRLGMEAVILGTSGNKTISADELADHAGTINYEIVCSLGNRLPRVYVGR